MNRLPDGAWPVMLLPLHPDRSIDWTTLDSYTDWLIEQGSAGLFPVALSGEMYDLSPDERLEIARRVVQRAAGRVPVIASIVESGPAEVHSAAVAELAATGVDAVVLIASMILDETDDESALLPKITRIIEDNPDVALGIYECPLPYHRILSTEVVASIAGTGRFVFFKETSHDVDVMRARVDVSRGTPLKVYNAGIETLVDSLAVGVSGLSGWVVNVHPSAVAWLCAHGTSLERQTALAAQDALDAVERTMGPTYPNSAKRLVAVESGLDFLPVSRWHESSIDEAELTAIATAFSSSWTVTAPSDA